MGKKKSKIPIAESHPELMKEWDWGKNTSLDPSKLTYGSGKKAWWKCTNGHEWKAVVANRSVHNIGCPYCSGKRPSKENNLATRAPKLLYLWDYEANDILPTEILPGSVKVVYWHCPICTYKWEASPNNRYRNNKVIGCPSCSRSVVTHLNNLSVTHPELAATWSIVNKIGPDSVTSGSHKKVWWNCISKVCGHTWKASVVERAAGKGCPACRGLVATPANCLAVLLPEIASQWHPFKNAGKTPHDFVPGSEKYAWWVCEHGHEWKAVIANRARLGRGCPKCCGREATKENNFWVQSIKDRKDWHPLNDIDPRSITPKSGKVVWWKCHKCANEWKASVHQKVRGEYNSNGCPCCAKGPVSKISQQWLDELGIPPEDREYRIKIDGKTYIVDGYDKREKILFEFLGDFWHGHPQMIKVKGEINQVNGKRFDDLRKETAQRFNTLTKAGYKVHYIWESNWRKILADRET